MKPSTLPNIKASVFIATSLDGFIARTDGSLDWLEKANPLIPPGEDCGFKSFLSTTDALIMGRHTFEKVLSFGQWPYGEKRVVVLSSNKINIPEELKTVVTSSSEKPKILLQRLSSEGFKSLYIDGGITIQRFLIDGLIDEITITIIPVLIGSGKPLFGELSRGDILLTLVSTQKYDFGFLQVKYRIEPRVSNSPKKA